MDQVEQWIAAARAGQNDALGRALEAFRHYLEVIARHELRSELQAKIEPSDLVQETFLAAQHDLSSFLGRTEQEWRAWLRSILLHIAENVRRRYLIAEKRRVDREVSLPLSDGGGPSDNGASPSGPLRHLERQQALTSALERLPESYRQVIRWHHREGWTFDMIGDRLECSSEAARKLWSRALARLRKELGPIHAT